ncbi:hypothetical protein J3A78_002337 [Streptomyces sp. PvR006]|nr:hypothetical protein [Streptomyces sp. PvR006]
MTRAWLQLAATAAASLALLLIGRYLNRHSEEG